MQRFWICMVLCVVYVHVTDGAEPLTPSAQRALTVAQEAFTPAWAPCGDSLTTQVLMPGGTEPFGFHQIEPVAWSVEQVYLPFSNNSKPSTEKIYQVSAYTTRYRSWHGTWAPWNTGTAWEVGNIEIFNARVTLPHKGAQTHASQYFVFTSGAFRKPLCKNIPSG
jgi:hypothetical protein